ncbi:hypothetical protein EJ06DRAFT_541141 [Trichodelitschia bisporula]|uniref:25S rRNA adenine-N(1) methyltransferase n=1 Tax=Trichodelitschia bisporula TaxID=703511 RepID=A0A6G1I8P2_9PEZI|nr:hypothetical protein EJ06DRAFT_541141 [Trichodelitschia bisporula]
MPPTKRKKSLASGRPPTARPVSSSLPSKVTRRIIRTHHTLQKAHAAALSAGDTATASTLAAQIVAQGGLPAYQRASTVGQTASRGGDSSRVLVQWVGDMGVKKEGEGKYRLLEVGCLAVDNACARSGVFEVERIDLRSQHPLIKEEDFMERPLPRGEGGEGRFHVVSLSLVVNYVPEGGGRGEMLRRVREFLNPFPALFLVLPAPCVTNSRYLDQERLEGIMNSLGFVKIREKVSAKLVYYLWRLDGTADPKPIAFPKVEVNPGKKRNNFAIVLR